jgi:hypothetical protein
MLLYVCLRVRLCVCVCMRTHVSLSLSVCVCVCVHMCVWVILQGMKELVLQEFCCLAPHAMSTGACSV